MYKYHDGYYFNRSPMMIFLSNFFSLLLICLWLSPVSAQKSQPLTHYPKQVLNLSSDQRIAANALLADKSKRQLSLIDLESLNKGQAREQYSIDIGKNNGDKKKKDDRRTPEGIYRLLLRKAPPEIPFETYGSLAYTTNYPNYFDKYENKKFEDNPTILITKITCNIIKGLYDDLSNS